MDRERSRRVSGGMVEDPSVEEDWAVGWGWSAVLLRQRREEGKRQHGTEEWNSEGRVERREEALWRRRKMEMRLCPGDPRNTDCPENAVVRRHPGVDSRSVPGTDERNPDAAADDDDAEDAEVGAGLEDAGDDSLSAAAAPLPPHDAVSGTHSLPTS